MLHLVFEAFSTCDERSESRGRYISWLGCYVEVVGAKFKNTTFKYQAICPVRSFLFISHLVQCNLFKSLDQVPVKRRDVVAVEGKEEVVVVLAEVYDERGESRKELRCCVRIFALGRLW